MLIFSISMLLWRCNRYSNPFRKWKMIAVQDYQEVSFSSKNWRIVLTWKNVLSSWRSVEPLGMFVRYVVLTWLSLERSWTEVRKSVIANVSGWTSYADLPILNLVKASSKALEWTIDKQSLKSLYFGQKWAIKTFTCQGYWRVQRQSCTFSTTGST